MLWRRRKATEATIASSGFSLGHHESPSPSASSANDDISSKLNGESLSSTDPSRVTERSKSEIFVVRKGYRVVGTVFAAGGIRIEGELAGRSLVAPHVTVASGGKLKAPADIGELSVHGSVTGAVKVRGLVEVHSGGELRGDVEGGLLKVHPGGSLRDATCSVGPKR